jgi:hypothetical protein
MQTLIFLKCGAAAIAIAASLPELAAAQTPSAPFTGWARFDAERRLTGTISADPDGPGPTNPLKHRAVRNTYDAAGRLTKVERGTLDTWRKSGTVTDFRLPCPNVLPPAGSSVS